MTKQQLTKNEIIKYLKSIQKNEIIYQTSEYIWTYYLMIKKEYVGDLEAFDNIKKNGWCFIGQNSKRVF